MRSFQVGRGHALALSGPGAERVDGRLGETADRDSRHRHAVPGAPLLSQQELVEGGALELLLGAAAAQVVLALVAHRVRIRLDVNLNQLFAAFAAQPDVGHDAEHVANLVRQIHEQLLRVWYADGHTLVVPAEHQHTACGIGEAAEPTQVVVTPRLLPFRAMAFLHTSCILQVSSSCIIACSRTRDSWSPGGAVARSCTS